VVFFVLFLFFHSITKHFYNAEFFINQLSYTKYNTHKFIFFLLCGSAPLREIDACRAVKFLPGLKNQKTAVGSIQ
jgi:hypothetical protein